MYSTIKDTLVTSASQTEKDHPAQEKNSAGGYSFVVGPWAQMDRFLILGTTGGSYYTSQRDLTKENLSVLDECLKNDGTRFVTRIIEISDAGRAIKNDPAIYALALASVKGDLNTRKLALSNLDQVVRIGTHLFHFLEYRKILGGKWNRGLRRAISRWYGRNDAKRLSYDLVKYQGRDGWKHSDVIKLAHPRLDDELSSNALGWSVWRQTGYVGSQETDAYPHEVPHYIEGYMRAQEASTVSEWVSLIEQYHLTREMLPTKALSHGDVWQALLSTGMPMTAMIRNLGVMSARGIFGPLSENGRLVSKQLTSQEKIRKARIHPMQVLAALMTYKNGRGIRGSLSWKVNQDIVDALNRAYSLSFENVVPTGKRFLTAMDVSGSMSFASNNTLSGIPEMTPRVAAAALAVQISRVENNTHNIVFKDNVEDYLVKGKSIETVVRETSRMPFGGTDCALPMIYAQQNNIPVDTFVIITDNETWYGDVHPHKALENYRRHSGIDAKLVVLACVPNRFSIANPDDPGMLDIVGFDTVTPKVISEFSK